MDSSRRNKGEGCGVGVVVRGLVRKWLLQAKIEKLEEKERMILSST